MLSALFKPENSAFVGAVSFLVTSFGFAISIISTWITLQQTIKAKTAAEAAKLAVSDFRFRVNSYSAYRDVNEACSALDECRRHLQNDAWRDASESHELGLRAITRLHQANLDIPADLTVNIQNIASQMKAFCGRVDAARAGKGNYPDKAKMLRVIRDHHEILTSARLFLESRISI